MTTKEKLQWLLAQENADGEANAQFAMLSRLSYDASAAVRGLRKGAGRPQAAGSGGGQKLFAGAR